MRHLRHLPVIIALAAACVLMRPVSVGAVSMGAAPAPARLDLPVVAFQVEDEAARQAAEQCAAAWTAEAPRLAAELGLHPFDPASGAAPDTVFCLVLDTASFGRLFGTRLPDWGVGVALPGGRVVALDHVRLPAVGRGVREVFLHEMVHALLMRAGGDTDLPAWLHEGLAMRLSGEWRFTDTVTLAMEGRVPDLSDLRGAFPGGSHRATRAYLTSELAVGRLFDDFGPDIVRRLLAAGRLSGDFRDAFSEVTGAPLEVFENRFARAMEMRFGWLVLLTRWPALFVLLALLLAVGAIARVIRTRRRLAAMPDDDGDEEADDDRGPGTGQPGGSPVAGCPDPQG
ncbi:MAG: hypothetical protein IPJ24_00700 [bacterium]|nr:hypothetical protein [bacterium]